MCRQEPTRHRVIVVEDTLKAFGKLGQYNRRQFKGTLIALTGSSGKTTVKEELKAVLSRFAPTYADQWQLQQPYRRAAVAAGFGYGSRYAVIEMGMSARGEIEYLTQLAEPDIAIVTNVYDAYRIFGKPGEYCAGKGGDFQRAEERGV